MTHSDEPTLGPESSDLGADDSEQTLLPDGSEPSGRTRDPGGAKLPRAGEAIGRFVVVRLLGRGGMGAVFLADDPQLGRQVAIKLVATGEPGMLDSVATARLIREAQAMARVTHPNLVHVYDVGSVGERVWIAMEYVPGLTLKQWLAEHADAPWSERLELFLAAGRGVAAAHRANLVHRDFKPDNVIVGADGIVRVLDFGLARDVRLAFGAAETSSPSPSPELALAETSGPPELGLTRTGALVGTPAYMSPEQLRGESTDARTDVFSFCVALFEALHGRRPFAADTYAELIHLVLGDTPVVVPSGRTPAWIDAALLRGLARDRADRWQSLDELLAVLDRTSASPSELAGSRRRWLVGGGIVVGVALPVVISILLWGPQVREPPTPPAEPSPTAAGPVAPSPDEAAAKRALAMVLIAPNGAERLNRAQQYVEDHEDKGGLGRLALAEATAALELWSSSCSTERMSLCLAVDEPSATPPKRPAKSAPTCFSPAMPAIAVIERDPTRLAQARTLTAAAVDHALAGGQPDPDDAIVEQAWNTLLPAAQSILADVALESYLQFNPPETTDVDALQAYVVEKRARLDEVAAGYDPVIRDGSGFAKVVALSRRAIARQALFDTVARMPIPLTIRGVKAEVAYCTELAKGMQPIATLAVEDFRGCIDEAMRARLSSEYVDLCEERVEALEKLVRGRVRAVIRERIGLVVECFNAGLTRDPDLGGKLSVRFTIEQDGSVSDSMTVGEPAFPDSEVAGCIEKVVRETQFPTSESRMTVTYPFILSSAHATNVCKEYETCDACIVGEQKLGLDEGTAQTKCAAAVADCQTTWKKPITCQGKEMTTVSKAG